MLRTLPVPVYLPRGYKSTVYDADGNKTAELVAEGTNRTYVKLENIPKQVQEAFIAIEDERFYEHNGIDLQGIAPCRGQICHQRVQEQPRVPVPLPSSC